MAAPVITSLPNRQLRNPHKLCVALLRPSLPNRQLRNEKYGNAKEDLTSLPNRQLRNANAYYD